MGIFLNINRPSLFVKNKENNSNMAIQILISILIAFVVGYFSIILAFQLKFVEIVLIATSVVVVCAAITLTLFLALGKKIFARLEV